MDTTNLNINPTAGADDKSEKTEKAKKVAGKAAQFAGAAGLGVAGTMAANAMNNDGEDTIEEITEEVEATDVASEEATGEELHAEPVTDFNPNDIMIDAEEVVEEEVKVEPVEVSTETNHDDMAIVEPQPITEEVITTIYPENDVVAGMPAIEPEEIYPVIEDMYGGPDGWDDFDHDDILDDDLLAENDDIDDDIDIADDLLG